MKRILRAFSPARRRAPQRASGGGVDQVDQQQGSSSGPGTTTGTSTRATVTSQHPRTILIGERDALPSPNSSSEAPEQGHRHGQVAPVVTIVNSDTSSAASDDAEGSMTRGHQHYRNNPFEGGERCRRENFPDFDDAMRGSYCDGGEEAVGGPAMSIDTVARLHPAQISPATSEPPVADEAAEKAMEIECQEYFDNHESSSDERPPIRDVNFSRDETSGLNDSDSSFAGSSRSSPNMMQLFNRFNQEQEGVGGSTLSLSGIASLDDSTASGRPGALPATPRPRPPHPTPMDALPQPGHVTSHGLLHLEAATSNEEDMSALPPTPHLATGGAPQPAVPGVPGSAAAPPSSPPTQPQEQEQRREQKAQKKKGKRKKKAERSRVLKAADAPLYLQPPQPPPKNLPDRAHQPVPFIHDSGALIPTWEPRTHHERIYAHSSPEAAPKPQTKDAQTQVRGRPRKSPKVEQQKQQQQQQQPLDLLGNPRPAFSQDEVTPAAQAASNEDGAPSASPPTEPYPAAPTGTSSRDPGATRETHQKEPVEPMGSSESPGGTVRAHEEKRAGGAEDRPGGAACGARAAAETSELPRYCTYCGCPHIQEVMNRMGAPQGHQQAWNAPGQHQHHQQHQQQFRHQQRGGSSCCESGRASVASSMSADELNGSLRMRPPHQYGMRHPLVPSTGGSTEAPRRQHGRVYGPADPSSLPRRRLVPQEFMPPSSGGPPSASVQKLLKAAGVSVTSTGAHQQLQGLRTPLSSLAPPTNATPPSAFVLPHQLHSAGPGAWRRPSYLPPYRHSPYPLPGSHRGAGGPSYTVTGAADSLMRQWDHASLAGWLQAPPQQPSQLHLQQPGSSSSSSMAHLSPAMAYEQLPSQGQQGRSFPPR